MAGRGPFAALGFAIGHAVPPRSALPVTNLIYLALAYAGGLWAAPTSLPHVIAQISPYTPTRALRDVLIGAGLNHRASPRAAALLIAYSAIFTALAALAATHDELRRHS